MNHSSITRLAVAALIGGLAATQASASVTYTYVGQNFNLINSSTQTAPDPTPNLAFTYATTDRITLTFTLASALASSANTDLALTSLSWAASDGKYLFGTTSQVGLFGMDGFGSGYVDALLDARFTTDSAGDISAWTFDAFNGAHASHLYAASNPFGVGEALGFATVNDYANSRLGPDGAGWIEWGAATTRGTWTVSHDNPTAVAEPGVLALLMAGCGLLGWQRRRPAALARG